MSPDPAFNASVASTRTAPEMSGATGSLPQAIVESSPIPIISVDLDGKVQTWNPASERLFGWTANEINGRDLPLGYSGRIHTFSDLREQVMREGAVSNEEVTRVKRDGTEFVALLTAAVIKDQKGKPTGLLAFVYDVAAERRAARDLSASEERYRSLFENEHTVMLIIDPESRCVVDANPAAVHFYGWTRQELIGMEMSRINTMSPERIAAEMQDARRRSRNFFMFEHRLKDGTLREVEVFSGPIVQAGRELLYSIVHDVTGRRQAEAHLKLKSAALDAAANSIVITYADGRIAWANSAFYRLSKYSEEEALGKTPGELIKSGLQDAAFYERMWKTLVTGSVWSGEVVNRMRDGRMVTEELTITPMLDEQGAISHYVGVKQDITDRKMLEKQYLRSQRVESIGTLAGGIAHDLNNVLAPILMAIDVLKSGEQDPGRTQMLERMDASARRGAELVKQVLAFSRGTEGSLVVMNIRHIAKEMETIISETFPKNIGFKMEYGRDLWLTLADLAVNGRDAMHDGGTLTLRLLNMDLKESYVRNDHPARSGKFVVMEVSDTGIGIPKENLDRIFDPFFSTKEPGKGTGLGLATVQSIVANHGGFLTVESELDKGTIFRVFLPAVEDPALDTSASLTKVGPGNGSRPTQEYRNGKRILVADDEDAIRTIASITLENAGFQVVSATNGAEALDLFRTDPDAIDLVILDGAMPVMDGKATLAAIHDIRPDARIVLSSGYIDADDERAYAQAGTTAFLHKPYSAKELLQLVQRVLMDSDRSSGGR